MRLNSILNRAGVEFPHKTVTGPPMRYRDLNSALVSTLNERYFVVLPQPLVEVDHLWIRIGRRNFEARHYRGQWRIEIEIVVVRDPHATTRVKHARIELPFVSAALDRLHARQEFVLIATFDDDQRQSFGRHVTAAGCPACEVGGGRQFDEEQDVLARSACAGKQ
jgi:hypothetical protein